MDFLKTLLAYMATTLVVAVESTSTPAVTPVPTPEPVETVTQSAAVETVTVVPSLEETATPTATVSVTPQPVPTITPNTKAYHNLAMGDRGEDVRRLQERLIELGYLPEGSADGAYGNQTRMAVRRFQYYNGLTVDGIAGRATQTNLFENPDVMPYPNQETPTPEAEMETPAPEGTVAAGETAVPTDTPEPAEPTVTPYVVATSTEAPTTAPTDTPEPEKTEAAEPVETEVPEEAAEVPDKAEAAENEAAEAAEAAEAVETEETKTAEPEVTGTVEPETTETAAPEETETAAPAETETTGPDTAVTAAPEETETTEPEVTETAAPEETAVSEAEETETSAPAETETPESEATEVVEDVDLDEAEETPSPEPTAEPVEIPYEDLAGWVVLNDSGESMQWTELEDGVPVVRSPRLQRYEEDLRISLDDLCKSVESWTLTDEGDSLVLEAQGFALSLLNEDAGFVSTVDGLEMVTEDGDFDFGEGHFIRVDFLTRALDGSWEWDAEEETLMINIPEKNPALYTD